jgi:hypothetical protein
MELKQTNKKDKLQSIETYKQLFYFLSYLNVTYRI